MPGLYTVFRTGSIFLYVIRTAILVYCVLSWFQPRFKAFFMLRQFIMPFISPFQALSLKLMRFFRAPIDFTCWFALIGLTILDRVWWYLYHLLRGLMY
ncbi:MAG: hypothetical protein E7337_01835 [Clostridiales bacterium]|nr:hypothetical protein [Clostridiales bacterium]